MYSKYAGTEVALDDTDYVLLKVNVRAACLESPDSVRRFDFVLSHTLFAACGSVSRTGSKPERLLLQVAEAFSRGCISFWLL